MPALAHALLLLCDSIFTVTSRSPVMSLRNTPTYWLVVSHTSLPRPESVNRPALAVSDILLLVGSTTESTKVHAGPSVVAEKLSSSEEGGRVPEPFWLDDQLYDRCVSALTESIGLGFQ